MAILNDGSVRVWDFQKKSLVLGATLPPSNGADSELTNCNGTACIHSYL